MNNDEGEQIDSSSVPEITKAPQQIIEKPSTSVSNEIEIEDQESDDE